MHKKGFSRRIWGPACAGFAGISLGTGLLRFAYTPIVPTMIRAQWTNVPEAAWLGSANFWGGLIGMLIALPTSRAIPRQFTLCAAMIIGSASLFACAIDFGFVWFACLRFIQGLSGALIMAILPGSVMKATPDPYRRVAGGITISGMGFALFPCLIFPSIDQYGPAAEWIVCGLLGTLCVLFAVPFSIQHIRGVHRAKTDVSNQLASSAKRSFSLFMISYCIAGVTLIPDALYLSDYLVRTLNASASDASALFAWFAAGLAVGASTGGAIAQRFGSLISIMLLSAVGLIGNSSILISASPSVVSIASFFFSLWVGGTVSMASIRTMELVGSQSHATCWPVMCIAYAIGMGVASSGFAALTQQGTHTILYFWIVEILMVLFIALVFCSYIIKHDANLQASDNLS